MTDLRNRMLEDLRLGGYSKATIKSYVESVAAFAKYHRKSPALCDWDDVRSWAMHLQAKGSAPPSIRLRLSGLKFFYTRTLRRPEVVAELPLPKVRKSMPVVLSASEVRASGSARNATDADVLHARVRDGDASAGGVCARDP